MLLKFFFFFVFIYSFFQTKLCSQTPKVEILTSGINSSIRGLSVVNDNIIWVSGNNGTVGKSSNGGKTWKWFSVKGFEKRDFRDIEAFDANTAIIMCVAEPAYILKTTDGGETWKVVFENKNKGMFLDAMDFVGNDYGIVVGDPIDKNIFLAETYNGGNTWIEMVPDSNRPLADSGEAFFAASGSNIRLSINKNYYIVSGGTKSRLIKKYDISVLPVIQGQETTGTNSIDVYDNGNGKGSNFLIVVGGDFNKESSTYKNCFISTDGGKSWSAPKIPPNGYRSCVEFLSKKDILTCGLNGVDYSPNGGKTWQWISKEGFHVCRIAKIGTSIFLAGSNGKIGKILWK